MEGSSGRPGARRAYGRGVGAFFTNVQVRLGDDPVEPLLNALRAAAGDVHEVATDDEADRVLLVLPPDAGGWVTIYDQATESQDTAGLEALGRLASEVCDAPAFSVLVHDSDVLDLRLYRGGERVDRYDSFPGYFEGKPSKSQKEEAQGHPDRWAAALSIDADALAAILGGERSFAEQTLRETCALVGCDPDRAAFGYRYATQEGLPDGTIALRFRLRERPGWEQEAEGPPRLELHAHRGDMPVPLGVGDALRLGFSARNVGGAGTGLTLSVWGGAIDEELVRIEAFELLVGDVRSGATHQPITPERGRSAEGALVFVDRPDQPLPAGRAAATMGWQPGVDVDAMMRAMNAGTVHVNLVGEVVKAGRGTLGVGFVPHANRADGQVGTECVLDVAPAMRRPLRFTARFAMGQASHLLRPLAGDSRLNALVVFDAPREVAAEVARDWLDDTPVSEAQVAVYRLDPQKRPKTRDGALNVKLACKDMREELSVQITARDWSFAFGTGVLAMHEDRRVVALRVSSASLERADAWRARIDEVAARGELLQAALYLSGPAGESLDVTAYEQACGAAHGVTTLRAWAERWVRVPGDRGLWLGASLAARLDDDARAALEEIAAVEPVGDGLRVVLREREHLDAFERALADLLPRSEDGHEVMKALYALA